jgi:LPS-assembly protein
MRLERIARYLSLVVLMAGAMPGIAPAQTLSDRVSKGTQAKEGDRLLVEAHDLIYDRDKNTVTALGDVQLYYQGKVLEADKVIYDRVTNRVFATGNAKLREPNGEIVYGDSFDLTNDFKNGFIDALRIERTDKTRFASPRAERIEGESTVFDLGTYTACEACKDDPAKPPLWQVRATRIIHNNEERTVYYENAFIDVAGWPVLWMPYLSAPDSTVRRKSGFLAPRYIATTGLGTGVSIPYFWALAPNYDLTVTPTLSSRQGVLGRVEWRHRLETGSYNIRVAGIQQLDKTAYALPPNGAGNKDFRGSIETAGQFLLNEQWSWGWDLALVTDKWFFQNYRVRSESLRAFNLSSLQSATSTVYLRGQGERSFFDARGYYFKTLSAADWQKQQPIVAPVIDYDKRFESPWGLGGETRLSANVTHLTREQADYRSLSTLNGSGAVVPGNYQENGHDTCLPGQYVPGKCYIRGIAGDTSRLSTELAWRRAFVDPMGEVWTPFTSLRADISYAALDMSGPYNQYQRNFVSSDNDPLARSMAAVGMTYRFPLVAREWGATHVIEPVAQIIARPNESRIGSYPNEDAQSLVFDDANLFSTNKFSGYDRIEGGTRANVGAQYTMTLDNGAFANALFGQSYQVAGKNSFQFGGVSQTGPQTGLDKSASDYVGRIQLVPSSAYSLTTRARFDESTWANKRLEVAANANFGPLSTNLTYGRYAAQPELGYIHRREGLMASGRYALDQQWYVFGGTALDFTRRYSEIDYLGYSNAKSNSVAVSSMFVGLGYRDECTLLEIAYAHNSRNPAQGTREPVKTIMLRLELRTLGATRFAQRLSSSSEGQ